MKLIKARAIKNLSQAQLADLVDMTQSQISNIEQGRNFPHATTRYKIEEVLGCPIDWMAMRLSGGKNNLTAIPENESDEDRVIREMEVFINSATKDQAQRYDFMLNFAVGN